MAFEYNQGNPLAGTTTATGKPNPATARPKAESYTPPQPSTFTYGLGNPLEQRITVPGQTLPTTVTQAAVPKPSTPTPAPAPGPAPTPSPTPTPSGATGQGNTSVFPAAGTFAAWEYTSDKKQRRMKFNDGKGGFYYGEYETSPADATQEELKVPERTLAVDTFKATLGLIMGASEAGKAYVSKLYDLVSGFYKTGSTVDEALNLALYQAETEKSIPEFTSRFKGIFSIRDLKQQGKAVVIPTIAEFIATEAKMGEVLTNAGLGDLATEEFLGGVIGKAKSVNEVASLISDVFTAIDYAPKELKQTLQTYFPGVDRSSIAKAILTGEQGAKELSEKVKGVSVLSAAQQQGVSMDLATATNIARQGYDYQQALTGFGTVKQLERANVIAQFKGGQFTSEQAQQAVFGRNVQQQQLIEQLGQEETARFRGSSGRLASQDRAAGLI